MLLTIIWKLYTKTVFGIRFWVLSRAAKLPDFFLKTDFCLKNIQKSACIRRPSRPVFPAVKSKFLNRYLAFRS